MAGHMGDKQRTIQNLEIIKSDIENNLMFIKGSIPGSKNSMVLIQKNAKRITRISTVEKAKKIQSASPVTSSKKVTKEKKEPSAPKDKPGEAKKDDKVKKWN